MGHRENIFIELILLMGMFEFIISLYTINSSDNKVFWIFRIINSLLILVLSLFLCDASNHHYQDGAAPILVILPCAIVIFIVCELSNLIIYLYKINLGLFSQSEHYIYISHLIILILYYLIIKKMKK